MTKKDFFRILIKLFGLYWLVNSLFGSIGFLVSSLVQYNHLAMLAWAVGSFLLTVFIFSMLVFHADKLIFWLKLDKGFDEDRINFQYFGLENIIQLGLIVIGGNLFVNNVPRFLSQTFFVLKVNLGNSNDIQTLSQLSYQNWFVSIVNLVIAYLCITNYPAICRFFVKSTRKKVEPN